MSYYGGSTSSRTRMKTRVFLNLYDLSPDANRYLWPVGLGLHHSGVEIMGREYSYGSDSGIYETDRPRVAPPGVVFRGQIDMGAYDGGTAELHRALDELRYTATDDDAASTRTRSTVGSSSAGGGGGGAGGNSSHQLRTKAPHQRRRFGPDDYDIVRNNCNHFANALCWLLLRKGIPGYVNRLSDIGVCCGCLFPKEDQITQRDGSGGQSSPPGEVSGGFMVRPGRNSSASSSNGKTPTFSGTGTRLGSAGGNDSGNKNGAGPGMLSGMFSSSSTTTSKMSNSKVEDDLTDRREKARKAALARLEQQSNLSSSPSQPGQSS